MLSPRELDAEFESAKEDFVFPTFKSLDILPPKDKSTESSVIYLCGNSLGLMPKKTRQAINDELDAWEARAVESHFRHPGTESKGKTPWMDIDLPLVPLMAPIVGGENDEVAVMGSLTSNLNALMCAFYKPNGTKTKILFEKGSFPSDFYAISNQIKLKGLDPRENMIQLAPEDGLSHLTTAQILRAIEANHKELALVMLPGIQYYTGQLFEIEKITKFAKNLGITVGWDLAHAAGNVPLKLHDWDVDFAAWCSYKYLNAGPGGISGIFIHNKYAKDSDVARLAGWWGNSASKRFQMLEKFEPIEGALGFRQSNPSVIDVVSLQSSLELFRQYGGIENLRAKSLKQVQYLEDLLTKSKYYVDYKEINTSKKGFTILTPKDANQRGSQLSLMFSPVNSGFMDKINKYLNNHGVICDERRPDVIRIAPTALYNTFEDIYNAVEILNDAMETIEV